MRSARASLCIGFPPEGTSGESSTRQLVWRGSGHDGRTVRAGSRRSFKRRPVRGSWLLPRTRGRLSNSADAGCVFPIGGCIRRNALKPDFTPERVDAPGTEHATVAIPGLANDRIQHNARVLELLHLSRFLINDLTDSLKHAVRSAAIRNHLGVEEKAAILVFGVQG